MVYLTVSPFFGAVLVDVTVGAAAKAGMQKQAISAEAAARDVSFLIVLEFICILSA